RKSPIENTQGPGPQGAQRTETAQSIRSPLSAPDPRGSRYEPVMLKRTSTAVWRGTGPKGTGAISTLSGALKDQPYGFNTRFASEDARPGPTPEELMAAAHASCFTMATAFQITKAGHEPSELTTVATVSMEKQDIGWTIIGIHLDLAGSVPGITA